MGENQPVDGANPLRAARGDLVDAEARRFYAERDRRTIEYFGSAAPNPVALWIGRDVSRDAVGQQCILTAVNMMARVHPHLILAVTDAPLRVRDPIFAASTLCDAVAAQAKAIDPYISIEFGEPLDDVVAVGIGCDGVPTDLQAYVGVLGATALRAESPQPLDHRGLTLGADMASCLAAASVFRQLHDLTMWFGGFSVWDLCESEDATGPDTLPFLDVGDVLVVGSGAVGSALS